AAGALYHRGGRAHGTSAWPGSAAPGGAGGASDARGAGAAAGGGGGGAPAGAVGAVGDRPSALPGAANDTVPTAAAGDDRQPALDLELGAPPGAGGDRRREWRGRAGGRRGAPRGGGSGCRRWGARFRPPGPLGHRGVRLFALAAAA